MRQTIIIAVVAAIVTVIVNVVALTQFGADTVRSASVADTSVSGNLPSSEEGQIQGDTDCDGDVDAVDGLGVLVDVVALEALTQDEPCTDVGNVIPAGGGVPGPAGPAGPQGDQGPAGEQGVQGDQGVSDYEVVSKTLTFPSETGTGGWITSGVFCPEGLKPLGGGGKLGWNGGFAPDETAGGYIISSFPSGASWSVTWKHDDTGGFPVGTEFVAYAICANVAE